MPRPSDYSILHGNGLVRLLASHVDTQTAVLAYSQRGQLSYDWRGRADVDTRQTSRRTDGRRGDHIMLLQPEGIKWYYTVE